nr:MAG TPA: hypothetical protein [Caudoviricetes sp.]
MQEKARHFLLDGDTLTIDVHFLYYTMFIS